MIPAAKPLVGDEERAAVDRVLRSGMMAQGPEVAAFEEEFSKYVGGRKCVAVNSGTSGLHMALVAAGIKSGDEVIVPSFTFAATANSVALTGATPVFVDIDPKTFNIDPAAIEAAITPRTKGIQPVHLYGLPAQMDVINEIACKHNILVFEDAAQAHLATFNGQYVGSFGIAGTFSFYPTKNITTIEGGMVITNSKKLAEHIRVLRNHGIAKSLSQRYNHGKPWDYEITEPGYNYRLDEVRSSLGLNQLKSLTQLNQRRRKAFQYYSDELKSIIGITPLTQSDSGHACHLYIIRVKKEFGLSRDKLFKKLLMRGIRTSVHYKPLSKFSTYRKYIRVGNKLENSESAYSEILSLPFYPQISKREQDLVVKCIRESNL